MSDPGLPAAVQRVMRYCGCNPGTRMNVRVCVIHLVPWTLDQCATAVALTTAAREDVADVVREARAAELEAFAKSLRDRANRIEAGRG